MKKSRMESLNTEREGDPGHYLWMRSLTEGADHPQEKWMKVDPGTKNDRVQNLWMIGMILLRDWMKTEIED